MIQRFTRGPTGLVDKLNQLVDEINKFSRIVGDDIIQVQRSPVGMTIGINKNRLAAFIPKIGLGAKGLSAGLLAWYQFSGTASDSSGNGHDGTLTNGCHVNLDAAFFDADNDLIDCGADFLGVLPLTICCWTFLGGYGEGNLGRIIDNGKIRFHCKQNGLNFDFGFSSDGGTTTASSAVGSAVAVKSIWAHIIAKRNAAGVMTFYIDGAVSGTENQASGTPIAGTTNVILGNNSGATATFEGMLDDIRIFNRELSAAEIRQVFDEGRYRKRVITEDVFYGAKIFEVQSNATGDGVYTCREEYILNVSWDNTTGVQKTAQLSTDEYEVLNLAEFNAESEYVRHLAAGDLIQACHYLDDDGVEKWAGKPFREGAHGAGVRLAYCSEAAPADNTITATLDHTTGAAITVTCHICNGSALNEAVPRLADNDEIFVVKIGATWYCTTTFDTSEDCVCEAP